MPAAHGFELLASTLQMYLAMASTMQIIGFRTVGNVELEVGSKSAETKREARPTRDQRVLHLCADLHHCVSPTGHQNIFSVFLKGPILFKTWTEESDVTPSRLFDVAPGAACILEVPHVARLVGCGNAGQGVRHPHEDDSVGVRPRRACHFVHRFRQACLNRGTESSGWSLLQFHMRTSRSSVRIPLRRSRVAQAHVLVSLDGERS